MLEHDRDIRELLGGRDLYIAEIHDVSGNGETNKTYGRIFYTRGKRLVFYAYDLDAQHGVEQVSGRHDDIQNRLALARKSFGHPTTKGDASEEVWLEMLRKYLPQRYQASKAHVVDSRGMFSEQIDVVVFDRQYSPFIFNFQGQTIIPAESVYGAFEAKQAINADEVAYAQRKVASLRRLHRTSLPIPHAGGTYPPKTPAHILGGLLTFESGWNPALGKPLTDALGKGEPDGRLDLGCVAAHGTFGCDEKECYTIDPLLEEFDNDKRVFDGTRKFGPSPSVCMEDLKVSAAASAGMDA